MFRHWKTLLWPAPLLLGLAVLACAGALLWAPIIYDDVFYILQDPLVRGPWPGWRPFFAQPVDVAGNFEPFTTLTHWLLYRLAGDQALLYRLSSLSLHWLNAVLVWLLFQNLLRTRRLALLGALLFALYPAHVEALAVSASKKHLFIALLCLLTLWIQEREPAPRRADPVCWALFAAAFTARESALLIPLLAFLWDRARPRPCPGGRRSLWLGYGAVLAAAVLWRLHFHLPLLLRPPLGGDWAWHYLNSGAAFLWYLSQLAWPWDLCFEHFRTLARPWAPAMPWAVAGGLLLALAGGVGLKRLYEKDRVAWLGAVWTLAALTPFLNLLPVVNNTLVSDRYLYLASAGFFLLLTRALARLPERPGRLLLAAAAAAAAAYAGLTMKRSALFTDPLALWNETARCSPDNPRVLHLLGECCARRQLYPEAEEALGRALQLSPGQLPSYEALAQVLRATGRAPEALSLAQTRLQLSPDSAGWLSLGLCRLDAGQPAQAAAAFQEARRLSPEDPVAALDLGHCLAELGRGRQARRALGPALREPRTRAQALRLLGDLDAGRGLPRRAASFYRQSLALAPLQIEVVRDLSRIYLGLGEAAQAERLVADAVARIDSLLARLPEPGRGTPPDDSGLLRSWRRSLQAEARAPAGGGAGGRARGRRGSGR